MALIPIGLLIACILSMMWLIFDLFVPCLKKDYLSWKQSAQSYPHCAQMNREQIISIYRINPSAWSCFGDKDIYYYTKSKRGFGGEDIAIYTSYKDYKWLMKKIKNYKKNEQITYQNCKEAKSLELIIADVQRNIEQLNILSNKEIAEASNIYARIVKNIVKTEES